MTCTRCSHCNHCSLSCLAWMGDGTRRQVQCCLFLQSSRDRRWRWSRLRRARYYACSRCIGPYHPSHELCSDVLSADLLILFFFLFLRRRLAQVGHASLCAHMFSRLSWGRGLLHAVKARWCTELDGPEVGHALCNCRPALQFFIPQGLIRRRGGGGSGAEHGRRIGRCCTRQSAFGAHGCIPGHSASGRASSCTSVSPLPLGFIR